MPLADRAARRRATEEDLYAAGRCGPIPTPVAHRSHPERCPFCGERAVLELVEAWSDHDFMLETCCLASHEAASHSMADDPGWARGLLRRLGAEELLGGGRLRRVGDDGCGRLLLDWNLVVRPVRFAVAAGFVRRHHVHCGAPTAWRFGARITNGPTLLGVVMVGNPVARCFNGRGIVEVNRLCVRRDVPAILRWNACSQLYAWSCKEAERRGFVRIVTYTRADEDGASLRAAGWTKETRVRGRSWNSRTRARADRGPPIDKDSWSRALKPRRRLPHRRPSPPSTTPLHLGAGA